MHLPPQLEEAKPLLHGVGLTLLRLLGPHHLHVAHALHVLAAYKHAAGAYQDAAVLLAHSREVTAAAVGGQGAHGGAHPLLLRSALADCANFRGPGYVRAYVRM